MTPLQQYQEDTLKKFDEKFSPLKGQLEVVVDMVEKNKIPSKVIECTCVPREGDCAYCQQEQKDESHNIALSEITTPLLEEINK